MNIKKISPGFFVAGQISAADVGAVAAQGVKTIMCNRPDHESQGQTLGSDIAAAAEGLGIAFLNVPVVAGALTENDIRDFETACHEAQRPILAYCRTGTRSTTLWALAEAKTLDVDAILSATKSAGYDLTAMRPKLMDMAARPGDTPSPDRAAAADHQG